MNSLGKCLLSTSYTCHGPILSELKSLLSGCPMASPSWAPSVVTGPTGQSGTPNSSLVFLLPHIPSHPYLSLSPRHSSSSLTILTRSPPNGLPDQQLCLLSFSLLNSHTEPSKHSNLTELPCLKLFDNFPEPTGQSPSSQA